MTETPDDLLRVIAEMREAGRPFAVATVVRTIGATSAKAGAKAVISEDGTMQGWIGGGCTQGAVRRAAAAVLHNGAAQLISVRPKDELEAEGMVSGEARDGVAFHKSGCPSRGTVDLFVEPMLPRPVLTICGASPVAHAIAEMAPRFGFAVAFATRAEDQDTLPNCDFRCVGFDLAEELPSSDFVIVATQGARDLDAVKGGLASGASYVAFVGSRRKFATLRQRLLEAGLEEREVDRVASPAGLNIGAITPDEIALSILAQVVAVRRQGAREPVPASGCSDAA